MRIKVKRGGGGGLHGYLLDEQKREQGDEQANPIFYTNMAGQTEAELTEEFRFIAEMNSRVQRTIAHYSISFPPGEQPDLDTKKQIIDRLLELQGHGGKFNCQFFAVEHFDKVEKRDVHHFHVAASTVQLDGSWVNGAFDWIKLQQTERIIERELGLQYCPPLDKGQQRNLTTGEARQEERTGQPCLKRQLWEAIDQACEDCSTMPIALMRVKAEGFDVRISEYEDGGKGLSFGRGGLHFQGRQLGHSFSFKGLQQYKGVGYQSDRDDAQLCELNVMTSAQCQQFLKSIEQQNGERQRQEREAKQNRWKAMRRKSQDQDLSL